jgi:alpha-1,2-glucosyltransferase
MLYIWPFIAFFSAPRLLPYVLQHLVSLLSPPQTGTSSKVLAHMTQNRLTGFCLFSSCAIALVIVHYNTIIHPFTLSDNRHYMFYIFRYTILRHWLVKYLAVPLYVACGWLVLKCLAGFTSSEPSRLGNKTRQSKSVSKVATFSGPSQAESQSANSTTTSFTLIFLLTTALSLITAPLVEPRYFIIPWVIWRLNVPALPVKSSPNAGAPKSGIIPALNWLFEERTLLWLETIQFLVINVVTGYMFLFKGFSWESELGRVQRFMW